MKWSSKSTGSLSILILAFAAAACSGTAPVTFPDTDQFSWNEVQVEIHEPVLITNAGDGSGRLFVVSKRGNVEIISEGELLPTQFLDIEPRIHSEVSEQGLLGLAFHPNYSENGYFYIFYTNVDENSVLSRFQVSDDPNRALHSSEKILLTIEKTEKDHNGGHLEFGPDGYLYIGVGDGGFRYNAISPGSLFGTILRIDVDGGDPYAIPKDNPFINGGGRPEVIAYGLRNPWSFSFDPDSGDMYIADVGEKTWEEVNYLAAGQPEAANFGWPYFEGNHAFFDSPPDPLLLSYPITEYEHLLARCAVTGGVFYSGVKYPAWHGIYLYADFCSGEIFGLYRDESGQWNTEDLFDLPINVTSIGVDEDGEIYALGFRRGFKLFMLSSK